MKNAEIIKRLDKIIEDLVDLRIRSGLNEKGETNLHNAIDKLKWWRDDKRKKMCPHCNENLD